MSAADVRSVERDAIAFLATQLGPRAPQYLSLLAEFDEKPLDGEGRTLIFAFDLPPASEAAACAGYDPRHLVAAGDTVANFFPAYGFDADDAYSFHIGTRFMLEMGISRVDAALEPPDSRRLLRAFVENYAGGVPSEEAELAALFRCDEGYYAVYRLSVGGQDVYCMGADCPPGFYKLTQFPPQTALRLHLGKLIRAEAKSQKQLGGAC